MTWSMWLVPPFVTSIFFVLGVITLYWSIFNWVTAKAESLNKPVNLNHVQIWVGALCASVSILALQMLVRDSHLSWTFTSFQLLILLFVAYFLQIRIPYWMIVIVAVVFMLINGNIQEPLSWVYTFIFGAFYVVAYAQSVRMWPHPLMRYLMTTLIFAMALWLFVKFRFSLSLRTYVEELINYMILAGLMYGYFKLQNKDRRIKDRLFQAANWDALTRVKNYAAYDREIGYQFQHSVAHHRDLAMIMFDIDHFKHINDTYGYLAGDEVLKGIASVVSNVLKKDGETLTLYRTGGEEFNVILPGYKVEQAQAVAQDVFNAVAQLSVKYNENVIHVTLSIGVSSLAVKDRNPLDFYKRVDANLYHSKKNGRMQITVD